MRIRFAACAALLVAASCGVSQAGPAEQASIEAGCRSSTNWSASACACVADRAGSLSPDQQSFLAATLNEQKGEAQKYATKLNPAQTMQAAMFMAQAGPGCQ